MTRQEAQRLDRYYRRTYGITFGQYKILLKMQRGRCAICYAKPKKRRLHVDHDHKTERVRGLLCFRCNRLYVAQHTVETAKQVYEYLGMEFDAREIEEAKATPKVRRKRSAVPQVPTDFLSPEGDVREKYTPTVWR